MAGINEWDLESLELRLYEPLIDQHPGLETDRLVQNAYDAALFNWDVSRSDRRFLLDTLRREMWQQYGVDFDTVFDWESYRASYDEAN